MRKVCVVVAALAAAALVMAGPGSFAAQKASVVVNKAHGGKVVSNAIEASQVNGMEKHSKAASEKAKSAGVSEQKFVVPEPAGLLALVGGIVVFAGAGKCKD